jgi:hypothetical protein
MKIFLMKIFWLRGHFSGAAGHSRTVQIICTLYGVRKGLKRESVVSKFSGLMKIKIAC